MDSIRVISRSVSVYAVLFCLPRLRASRISRGIGVPQSHVFFTDDLHPAWPSQGAFERYTALPIQALTLPDMTGSDNPFETRQRERSAVGSPT